MDNIEPDIFCELEQSKINPNLYICKYCNVVVSSKDGLNNNNIVCSVRLDRAAQDPRFENVRLVKTTIETPEGQVLRTYENNIDKKQPSKVLGDWWFGNNHVANIATNPPNNATAPMKPMFENTSPENQCSQQEIDNRLSICQSCEFYKNNTCLKCGCALSRERNFMNKLYWKDKSCPIGKWGSVE